MNGNSCKEENNQKDNKENNQTQSSNSAGGGVSIQGEDYRKISGIQL